MIRVARIRAPTPSGTRPVQRGSSDLSDARPSARGFTLLELAVVLGLIGLVFTFLLPRAGLLGSAALDSSARRLATRVQFLREEAALRNQWIRLAVDPRRGTYRAERLEPAAGGARFAPVDRPLYRETKVPAPLRLSIEGTGITTSLDGYETTLFSPDGYADPALLRLDDGAGRQVAILIDPVSTRARILDDEDIPERWLRGLR